MDTTFGRTLGEFWCKMQKQVGSLGACPLDIFKLESSKVNRSETITDHAIALNQEHLDHDFSTTLCLVCILSLLLYGKVAYIEIIEIRGAYKN